MIETVKSMSGPNLQGELGRSIRMMQACSLTPGEYQYEYITQLYLLNFLYILGNIGNQDKIT